MKDKKICVNIEAENLKITYPFPEVNNKILILKSEAPSEQSDIPRINALWKHKSHPRNCSAYKDISIGSIIWKY